MIAPSDFIGFLFLQSMTSKLRQSSGKVEPINQACQDTKSNKADTKSNRWLHLEDLKKMYSMEVIFANHYEDSKKSADNERLITPPNFEPSPARLVVLMQVICL